MVEYVSMTFAKDRKLALIVDIEEFSSFQPMLHESESRVIERVTLGNLETRRTL